MNRRSVGVFVSCGMLVTALASAAGGIAGKRPACVAVSSQVVITAVGNNHVVNVANRCKKAIDCKVWTDVAPEKLALELDPADSKELVTFRGSPASVFQATVECREK